jgi:hypothetical protein
LLKAGLTTPRIAAFKPGQSPPLVKMPMHRARLEDAKIPSPYRSEIRWSLQNNKIS